METWELIEGYEHQYEVSNMGNVRNIKRGRKLSLIEHHTGYIKVNLYKNGDSRQYSVHRLVATAFVDNPFGKTYINHKNGIKSDNKVENLEWVTRSENVKHAFKLGLCKSPFKGGENHTQNKLSRNDVLQIRSVYEQGFATQKKLSEAYDIAPNTVSQIVNRNRWAHI